MPLTRREFTRQSALAGAGVALTGAVGSLATAPGALAAEDGADIAGQGHENGEHAHGSHGPGYGPLIPDPNGLLALPAGFSYRVITRAGVTKLESGEFTPTAPPSPSRHSAGTPTRPSSSTPSAPTSFSPRTPVPPTACSTAGSRRTASSTAAAT
jgi:hypothetical protein